MDTANSDKSALVQSTEGSRVLRALEPDVNFRELPELAGYRLIKPLGRGGQGQVFQAIRLSDNRKVAIKYILPGHLADAGARARFETEWQTLELLNHPNIVRVLDHGTLDTGELWFAAEYIDGVPVNQYVHDLDRVALAQAGTSIRPEFPLKKVLDLFVHICEGVEAAHQAGVFHRDLKPANILVDGDDRPHILDFGIARSPQQQSPDAVSLTGQFMGSLAWSSPEQIEARPLLIDARTDVYAIGMMLYHALTGDFPFDVNQPWLQLVETIRTAEPTPPREIRSFIDADLQTIVLTAIAKQKERRYSTVAALREDIERYLVGLPICARANSRFYRMNKFIRRNRLLVAATGIVVLLTVGYAISVTRLYRRAETHAADARAKFRAARDMLDFTLSQIDTELTKLAGASAVRRNLLEKAYAQLDAMLKEKTGDPELQADIAKAHSKLADIAQGLGRWERAGEEVAAALEIRRKLAADNPDDPESQAELSIALVRVGDVACGRGDRLKGHALYKKALLIDEALVAAHPENLHYLDNLSWSYDRLCWAARLEGNDSIVNELHDKRLALALRLNKREPANLAWKRNLLSAYILSASIKSLEPTGPDLSLDNRAEAAGTLASELLATDPNNKEYLRGLVIARRFQALVLADDGRFDEARELWREPLELIDRVLAVEPEDREWNAFRVIGLNEAGDYALKGSKSSEAEPMLRSAVAYAEELVINFPNDGHAEGQLADARFSLAGLYWQTGRQKDARDQYRECIRVHRALVDALSCEPNHLRNLANLLLICPDEELRDPAFALELAKRGVDRTNRRHTDLLRVLAIALQANEQLTEARKTAEEAVVLLRPGPSQLRRDLEAFLAAISSQ